MSPTATREGVERATGTLERSQRRVCKAVGQPRSTQRYKITKANTDKPGSTERWGDTIYGVAINCAGDYIIVGDTDNANLGLDNVVVLNGAAVVMREGDPVDLNGNGLFDDSVFIGRANNTMQAFSGSVNNGLIGWWLSADRTLHGLPMLVDGGGLELNTTPAFGSPNAFVRVSLPCRADFNVVGGVSVQDIFDFLAAYFAGGPGADFNCTGGVTVQDIFDFLAAYFTPC